MKKLLLIFLMIGAVRASAQTYAPRASLPTDPTFNSVTVPGGTVAGDSSHFNLGGTIELDLYVGGVRQVYFDGNRLALTGILNVSSYCTLDNGQITTDGSGNLIVKGSLKTGNSGTAVKTRRYTTAALASGVVTIADTAITATTQIYPSNYTTTGTPGVPYVSSKTAGTGYTITSSNGAATNQVSVEIVDF